MQLPVALSVPARRQSTSFGIEIEDPMEAWRYHWYQRFKGELRRAQLHGPGSKITLSLDSFAADTRLRRPLQSLMPPALLSRVLEAFPRSMKAFSCNSIMGLLVTRGEYTAAADMHVYRF